MQSTAPPSDRRQETPAADVLAADTPNGGVDDYLDLPGAHNIIFLLYGLGTSLRYLEISNWF